MKLGRVCGTVVATIKDPSLEGLRLRLIEPEKADGEWSSKPIVAIDSFGARDGDVVIWISAREATLAVPHRVVPTDAAIVGIVDQY